MAELPGRGWSTPARRAGPDPARGYLLPVRWRRAEPLPGDRAAGAEPLPARRPAGVATKSLRQLPSLVVLVAVAAGLLLTAAVEARTGVIVVGLALLLAGALRLSLPTRRAGWLAVRTRSLDATFLLVVGFALILLGTTIPKE